MRVRLAAEWCQLRPGMRWALVISLLASMLALTLPPSEDALPSEPPTAHGVDPQDVAAPATSAPAGTQWRRLLVGAGAPREPAEADPFELRQAAAPTAPPTAPTVVAPPAPAPVQEITAPAPRYRVAGWLDAGEGRLWLLSDGQHELVAKPGMTLLDGYMVQAIEPRAIRLQHTATQTQVSLPLPALPTVDGQPSS